MGLADRLTQINNGKPSTSIPNTQTAQVAQTVPQPPIQSSQSMNYPQQQPPIQQQQYQSQPSVHSPRQYPQQQYSQQPSAPPMNYQQKPQASNPVPIPQTPINKFKNTFTDLFSRQSISHRPVPTQPGPFYDAAKTRIDRTIVDKKLQYFSNTYVQKYQDTLLRASHVDYVGLANKRGFSSVELALDLASLAPYDVFIHIDNSGSMLYDESWKPDKEKVDDVKLILDRIVDIAKEFDDDGISIRTFNGNHKFDDITTTQQSSDIVSKIKYSGGTPLASSLRNQILRPYVYDKQLQKPIVIYIITDGQPDNKEDVRQVIQECKSFVSSRYSEHAVSFMFAQVGKDPAAASYLNELDVDPYIKDDVDTIGNYELECARYAKNNIDLTPDLWMLQMMLGSVNSDYDEGND
jgi:hypothetical protein